MVAPVSFLPPPGLGESPHPHGEVIYKTAQKTSIFLKRGSRFTPLNI